MHVVAWTFCSCILNWIALCTRYYTIETEYESDSFFHHCRDWCCWNGLIQFGLVRFWWYALHVIAICYGSSWYGAVGHRLVYYSSWAINHSKWLRKVQKASFKLLLFTIWRTNSIHSSSPLFNLFPHSHGLQFKLQFQKVRCNEMKFNEMKTRANLKLIKNGMRNSYLCHALEVK